MNPTTMNPVQVLLLCWAAGAVLSRDGDRLRVEASKASMPSELLEALRVNKPVLLAILPERSEEAAP